MIFESQVVEAVSEELSNEGWTIISTVIGQRPGDDIVARMGTDEIRVEAKGETSENPNSAKYGQPFDRSQVSVHVAKAFHKAAATQQRHNCIAGIAFPDNQNHRDIVAQVSEAITTLGIWVFWVSEDKRVIIEN